MGDLRSIETFEIAGIDRARCVVACGKDDIQNALVSITAKTANPDIRYLQGQTRRRILTGSRRQAPIRQYWPRARQGRKWERR